MTHYLFDLLFMCRVKDVSLVLFQLFLVYFVLLKVQKFLKITFFSLSKRKSVKKLTQLSTKISKFSYFSFTFKLNGKKKMPLKNIVWRRELQEKFCWRRDLIWGELKIIQQKKGGLTRKGWRKNWGVYDPQKNYGVGYGWVDFRLSIFIVNWESYPP